MAIRNQLGIIIDQDLYDHGSLNSLEMITEIGTADPPIEIIAEEGSWPPGDRYPTMITEGYNDASHYTNRQ
tara:strand:+ start:1934 stop:2146 length:213 start_codon:yes stop_codon:yes gene_type:complete